MRIALTLLIAIVLLAGLAIGGVACCRIAGCNGASRADCAGLAAAGKARGVSHGRCKTR